MKKTTGKKFDLIVFDIDGTLTRSKLPLESEMAEFLCRLMEKHMVAIISGASYEQFKRQILDHLACSSERMKNLYLLPTDGTIFCHNDRWQCENDAPLSREERECIKSAFENIFEASRLSNPAQIYGELIEDRGAHFNFSALGQDAPIELKEKWDPDHKKRKQIVEVLKRTLSDFSIHIAGTTSIEITRYGIDKAYGLNKLMGKTGVPKEKILYVGDKFFKGGNDEPVMALGIECRAVANPEETKKVMLELLGQN